VALSIISVAFVLVGGVNLGTFVFAGILIFIAFIITVVMGFGLTPEKKPEKIFLRDLKDELSAIKEEIKGLNTQINEIKKLLEE